MTGLNAAPKIPDQSKTPERAFFLLIILLQLFYKSCWRKISYFRCVLSAVRFLHLLYGKIHLNIKIVPSRATIRSRQRHIITIKEGPERTPDRQHFSKSLQIMGEAEQITAKPCKTWGRASQHRPEKQEDNMDRYNMIENAKYLLEIIDPDQYPDLCFYLTSGSSNNGRRQNPFSSSHRHKKPLSPS